ncbi:hypothetical protein SBOR_2493 [Sclerotinia borealis F-4128]|uniref:Uncharacterized protein n=1 Tax=Sclerotinia borealis (strain F-4128) TaxID=1432307 RepID=W9CRL4_SCLBF|nr:hypothetical protein SBOR_2493 [Sclerotinia borealis F-4128]
MSYSFVFNDTPQVLNIFSEWLCWCILWAGIKVSSFISQKKTLDVRRDKAEEESTSLAFFVVTSSVCASIVEVNWILPFLTPALYIVTQNNSVDKYVLPSSFKSERSEYPANYGYHLIFYILIAISTSVLFLPSSANPVTIGLGLIFLICQTATYSRLSRHVDEVQSVHQLFSKLEGTCCWVVCFLTVILLVSQQQAPDILRLSVSSIFKASLWIAMMLLCNEGHACVLTLMSTFGLSTMYINVIPSPILAALSCLCALLILAHITSTLPHKCSTRRIIIFFAIFPIAALLFRFGISETIEAFSEMVNGLFTETLSSCTMNGNSTVRDVTDIVQTVIDEPSRLVAEFGPREEPKSWLDAIARFSNPYEDSTPVTIELR